MGMAGRRRKRRSENRLHSQPGQPHLPRPLSHLRQRCLGARLLSQIQQPPSRVFAGMVERCQLGRNQQALPVVSQEVMLARVERRFRSAPLPPPTNKTSDHPVSPVCPPCSPVPSVVMLFAFRQKFIKEFNRD